MTSQVSEALESTDWNQNSVRDVLDREQIVAMNQRRNLPGFVFFFGHNLVMLATGYLLYLSLGTLWVIPTMLLHGIVVVYWFQPFHECAHRTAFKTPWLNTFVYWYCALISILEPTHFYYEHMQHHRYTQHPQTDPERIPQADKFAGYLFYLSAIPYFYYQLSGLFSHFMGRIDDAEKVFIPEAKRSRVIWEARLSVAIYCALFVLSLYFQSWFLLIYWLIPRVAGEPFMRAVRLSEHQGCSMVPDMFCNTRTVIASLPLQYLGWFACFHAEHHLSPNTPFHAVKKLHMLLRERFENIERGYLSTHVKVVGDIRFGRLPKYR